jgi:hypothetical protein
MAGMRGGVLVIIFFRVGGLLCLYKEEAELFFDGTLNTTKPKSQDTRKNICVLTFAVGVRVIGVM